MEKIERLWETKKLVTVNTPDLDRLEAEKCGCCEWRITKNYFDDFICETSCGDGGYFREGGIKENHYKYCPYCGKEIKEIQG